MSFWKKEKGVWKEVKLLLDKIDIPIVLTFENFVE